MLNILYLSICFYVPDGTVAGAGAPVGAGGVAGAGPGMAPFAGGHGGAGTGAPKPPKSELLLPCFVLCNVCVFIPNPQ